MFRWDTQRTARTFAHRPPAVLYHVLSATQRTGADLTIPNEHSGYDFTELVNMATLRLVPQKKILLILTQNRTTAAYVGFPFPTNTPPKITLRLDARKKQGRLLHRAQVCTFR